MIIDPLGEATPLLDEVLEANVKNHFTRLHDGKWKLPLID